MTPRSALPSCPVVLLAAGSLRAQTAAAPPAAGGLAAAAATITGGDVMRRVGIIADDSMMGRDTPSRGLELTAKYVADQFRRFGLKPGGDSGTWFQRYPITRRQLSPAASRWCSRPAGTQASARFDRSARYVTGGVPAGPLAGPAVSWAARSRPTPWAEWRCATRSCSTYPTTGAPMPGQLQSGRCGRSGWPGRGDRDLANLDSAAFAARVPVSRPRERYGLDLGSGAPPFVEVSEWPWRAGAPRRRDRPRSASRRGQAGPPGRAVARASGRPADSVLSQPPRRTPSASCEGSDPELRHEYVVFSAHMDHIGITPGQPDSINNGADDDGSGTTGVIELAEAFSRPGARPGGRSSSSP